jgi:glutamine amidotransferase
LSAGDVVIIANGGANIASLQFALQRLGVSSAVSGNARKIRGASHVILPGVGAAGVAMTRLKQSNLDTLIPSLAQPVLGICLGMQLLFEGSDEGDTRCLGIIPGRAARFPSRAGHPVPHMGWNTLKISRPDGLLDGVPDDAYAYFVHSYAIAPSDASIATCDYGQPFTAAVQWRNFVGAQFHPERSAQVGAQLLQNFLRM